MTIIWKREYIDAYLCLKLECDVISVKKGELQGEKGKFKVESTE